MVAIRDNPEYDFYNLNIEGGMWVRRIIDRIVAEEQGRARTHPSEFAAVAGATQLKDHDG